MNNQQRKYVLDLCWRYWSHLLEGCVEDRKEILCYLRPPSWLASFLFLLEPLLMCFLQRIVSSSICLLLVNIQHSYYVCWSCQALGGSCISLGITNVLSTTEISCPGENSCFRTPKTPLSQGNAPKSPEISQARIGSLILIDQKWVFNDMEWNKNKVHLSINTKMPTSKVQTLILMLPLMLFVICLAFICLEEDILGVSLPLVIFQLIKLNL